MIKTQSKKLGRLAQVLALLSISAQALAAPTPADIEAARRQAEILQRQQQEQILRDQQLQEDRVKKPGGLDAGALMPEVDASQVKGKCRDIHTINVQGATKLSKANLQEITLPFMGRCLGVAEVEQILGEITRAYLLRGFLTTRAYLPAQDLSKGELTILVVEGKIEEIRIESKGRKGFLPENTMPSAAGDLLNLRDLEQGIDQINRLQSNRATLDIAPGSQPGQSVVIVRNEPARFYRVTASADNQGSEPTGEHQLGLTVSADSLLGASEFLMFTHRESVLEDRNWAHSTSDSLMLAVPYGYNTFTYSGSISEYLSTLRTPGGLSLETTGESITQSLSWDRVVFRNQNTRANVTSALITKKALNYLEGQLLAVSSRTLSIIDLDANLSTGWGGGILGLNLGWSQGVKFANALNDVDSLPYDAPRAQFRKFKYGASYFFPFSALDHAWSYSASLTGQNGITSLYGSEQISIGSLYSVRGFVSTTYSGDKGYYVRNDLSMRTAFEWGAEVVPARWYMGLDVGSVRNRAAGVPEGSLVGAALGVVVNWRGASLDLSNTCPLETPGGVEKEPCQTWFRLSYSI